MASDKYPRQCRIKSGWADAGKEGALYAVLDIEDRQWAVVMWDDEDDPELFRALAIEVSEINYKSLTDHER